MNVQVRSFDPSIVQSNGRTPLINAALQGSNEVMEMLLNHGARVNAADKVGGKFGECYIYFLIKK